MILLLATFLPTLTSSPYSPLLVALLENYDSLLECYEKI
jgi:hypothetical protein